MRTGRIEEANSLSQRIGKDIANHNKLQLSHIDPKKNCSKGMWAAVRQLTGRRQNIGTTDGVSVDTLNQHYAQISSDSGYQPPEYRHTAACNDMDIVSEWQVFKLLDTLIATATRMELLPSWFLRIGAPFLHTSQLRAYSISP